jgi:hypothetical protein
MALPLLLLAAAASAQPMNYVSFLTPRGGQRGTTVEVVFHGSKLATPRQVLFFRPGIECLGFEPMPPEAGVTDPRIGRERVKAKFRIAADCPLGEHPLRLLTSQALCEAVTFWVGPFPVVEERERRPGENDTPERAEPVPLNVAVHGEMSAGDRIDRDCYRVRLAKGQRLSVEVEAARLGTLHYGGEVDTTARVLGPDGKQLARCDDSALFLQDPHLTIIAPADGDYIVEISQPMYYPPTHAFYRAHIGTFFRPTAVYPAGGCAGETLPVRVIGDPAGDFTQSVKLPDRAGDFELFAGPEGARPPSANPMRVSPYPNVLEAEPNDTPATATRVPSLPAALNGIISAPGDDDCFRVTVEQGQAYRVKVFGRGLGNPIDPKVRIRPADAAADAPDEIEKDDSDKAAHDLFVCNGRWFPHRFLDPVFVWRPRRSSDYILEVSDTRGKGGPDYVYRVEIEPAPRTVHTFLTSPNGYQHQHLYRMDVPRGSRFTRNVSLAANFGGSLSGDYELEAVGLPPGVTMIAPRFRAGVTTLPVQFVAADDAPFAAAAFELLAKPVVAKGAKASTAPGGSFHGMAFTDRRNGLAWHFVFLDRLHIGVTDPAPFKLELAAPGAALARNGELTLTAKVRRAPGFTGPVDVWFDWLPPGVQKEPPVTVPADKDEIALTIRADDKAAAGTYPIALTGSTTDGDPMTSVGRVRLTSAFLDLAVSEPYVEVVIGRSAVERGAKGRIICDLKHLKPLPSPAAATLKRLPHGVRLLEPLPTVKPGDKQVVFAIEATEDALVGQYKDIFCELTVLENGQAIRQQTGSGVLRVDPSRKGSPSPVPTPSPAPAPGK